MKPWNEALSSNNRISPCRCSIQYFSIRWKQRGTIPSANNWCAVFVLQTDRLMMLYDHCWCCDFHVGGWIKMNCFLWSTHFLCVSIPSFFIFVCWTAIILSIFRFKKIVIAFFLSFACIFLRFSRFILANCLAIFQYWLIENWLLLSYFDSSVGKSREKYFII